MWFDFAHQPGGEREELITNAQYFDFAQYKCPMPNTSTYLGFALRLRSGQARHKSLSTSAPCPIPHPRKN
ncbi:MULTISPECIES: hypothetical protein [unclassified Nostoc]|uniref:hypothetical protein n=1 Tax=unclassified Nostoc TaxID=2593658 RepID=UPI0025F404FD|nr:MULTISPECIES: hypothetical protein [unclassified Nostoc]